VGSGSPGLWAGFIGAVVVLLLLDLFVFHPRAQAPSTRGALAWSAVWIALSLAFNGFVALHFGHDAGVDFLTAYLVEKSLSIDNLFAFLVIFASFGIKPAGQHRVLFWGIFGALVMRALMIFGGIALLQRLTWLIYPMGLFLVFTAVKLFADRHKGEKPSRLVTRLHAMAPSGRGATLVALIAVELTDIIFAADSVPAVLAVTDDPFLVFTSNICALLGLRSLFFALSNVVAKFRYLKLALSGVLLFVGAKMLVSSRLHLPHGVSLAVIAVLLGAAIVASSIVTRRQQRAATTAAS
jgi:tellurite resistance protein TerC